MALTSPLTTLATISTPESYYTARDSSSIAADDTTLSSPVEDHPPEKSAYRDAVQLPHELKSHCQIHLEEQLYTAAIQILSGLLSDGSTTTTTTHAFRQLNTRPALIPPPSQIALLATLIIHPTFTSRAPETSNIHAASHALSYLRGLVRTVGPINANLRAAFDFNTTSHTNTHINTNGSTTRSNSAHDRRNTDRSSSSITSSDGESDDALTGPFARSQLVFTRGRDFWAVLGWAFRCAAEHPHRWRHWRLWLDLVLSAVEADFDERLARDRQGGGLTGGSKSAEAPYPMLGQSLFVAYLGGLRRERKNALKEVLRAVFAFSDGENGVSDRALFREVFEREALLAKGPKSKRKRGEEAVVDLENDRFGDYLDGDEFESDEEEEGEAAGRNTPQSMRGRKKPARKAKGADTNSFTLTNDIAETVPFRLRIFRLLSAVSYYLPEALVPVDKLYESFTDHVRGLPLSVFRLFVEPHHSILPEGVQVTFLRVVIEEMLPWQHPDPADVDPDNVGAGTVVTMLVMRECFLPFAANRVTAEDNAKLSLALESMMWFVYSQIEVEYSEKLRRAVEKGIKAREDKIKRRGAGATKGDGADGTARAVLARSARNLRALVDVIAAEGR